MSDPATGTPVGDLGVPPESARQLGVGECVPHVFWGGANVGGVDIVRYSCLASVRSWRNPRRNTRSFPQRAGAARYRPAGTGCGSLIAEIWNPAVVKASVIACSGRFQKLIWVVWPPLVQSSVQL